MTDQMTTHQAAAAAAAAAQASSFSFNVAGAHPSLSIITIQQAQSSCSETLKFKVNLAGINAILPSLPDIKNPAKLKEISNMKFTDSIFHE